LRILVSIACILVTAMTSLRLVLLVSNIASRSRLMYDISSGVCIVANWVRGSLTLFTRA